MIQKILSIYKKYKEIINYLIFGFLTTVISLAAYYISVYTFLNPNNNIELQIANIISWIFGVTFAYITNRKYVFNSNEKNIFKETLKFCSARLSTLLMDMLLMYILVSTLHLNDKIIKPIVSIIVIIANYILSKLIVFKNKKS